MRNITQTNIMDDIREVFDLEAQAINELKTRLDNSFEEAVHLILNSKGRVIVCGIGKSGQIGKKISATLSSTGTPSLFLHPAEGLHGDLGMVTEEDVILAISNSGESEEVLKTIPSIKRIGAKIIGVVGNRSSTLSEQSDVTLEYGKVEEACPLGLAPTTTTTLTLVIGDALAVALLKARDFKPENFALYHPGGSLGKKLLLTVRDLFKTENTNPMINEEVGIKEALFTMTDCGMGAVSVVNNEHEIIGILTDGDIRRALAENESILSYKVKDICSLSPITVYDNAMATEALRIMEEKRINVLSVVDQGNKPLSMIHINQLTQLGL